MQKEIISPAERVFQITNYIILTIASICAIYPFLYVLFASISYGGYVDTGQVVFWPKGINLDAYRKVLGESYFWTSYANTFFYTIFGTIFSMIVTAPAAYSLSKKRFAFRKTLNLLLVFTMWFNVGFIPQYLNFRSLGVQDSRWGIVVSFGVQAFNVILLRNYFEAVSESLEEASKIDGCNDFMTFLKIYLPLSKPALATVWLYYAIGRWNGYFWSSVLLTKKSLVPLQIYLKQMVIDMGINTETANTISNLRYSYATLVYAVVICSVIPIVAIYPFIQRYFTKGIMVGGVKE